MPGWKPYLPWAIGAAGGPYLDTLWQSQVKELSSTERPYLAHQSNPVARHPMTGTARHKNTGLEMEYFGIVEIL